MSDFQGESLYWGPVFLSALKCWQKYFQGYGYYSNYFSNFFFERNPFFAERRGSGVKGALTRGGKPSFWQENRDTFKMSNYGGGGLGSSLYREFPRCFQSAWPLGVKASLGFSQGCWESFSPWLSVSRKGGNHGVVLIHALGDLCLVQIGACFLGMCRRPPQKSKGQKPNH